MASLGVPTVAATAAFARLAARYRRPPRAYHTLAHARQVVTAVEQLARYAVEVDSVRLAAWHHDAVYEPGATDNEVRSAIFAARSLSHLPLAPARIREVERLIRLTATHRAAPGDDNGQVLSDADLAILGAPPPTYEAYARAIRREYAFVEADAYRRGRLRVLRHLLARSTIYYTPVWQQEREPRARQNLRREITRLQER